MWDIWPRYSSAGRRTVGQRRTRWDVMALRGKVLGAIEMRIGRPPSYHNLFVSKVAL